MNTLKSTRAFHSQYIIIHHHYIAAAPIPSGVDEKKCINHQDSGRSGQMYSPGYPADYPNNINYTWTLVSGSNNTFVNFTIVDLQAESDSKLSCFDYLIVSMYYDLKSIHCP